MNLTYTRSALAALPAIATLASATVAAPALMLGRFSDDSDDIWEPFLRDDEPEPAMAEGRRSMRGRNAGGPAVG